MEEHIAGRDRLNWLNEPASENDLKERAEGMSSP